MTQTLQPRLPLLLTCGCCVALTFAVGTFGILIISFNNTAYAAGTQLAPWLGQSHESEAVQLLALRQRCETPAIKVERYAARRPRYFPYDPETPQVAGGSSTLFSLVEQLFKWNILAARRSPAAGAKESSTCWSLINRGAFFVGRDALDRLGFQRQCGPEAFPESRPMRVGAATIRVRRI